MGRLMWIYRWEGKVEGTVTMLIGCIPQLVLAVDVVVVLFVDMSGA